MVYMLIVISVALIGNILLTICVLLLYQKQTQRMSAEPNLAISPQIAYRNSEGGSYSIKMLNWSSEAAVRLEAELMVVKPVIKDEAKATIRRGESVPLKKSRVMSVAGWHDDPDQKIHYDYRWRVVDHDLRRMCTGDDVTIRFKVIATHPVSGITRVFQRDFANPLGAIVVGVHVLGSCMDVRPAGN